MTVGIYAIFDARDDSCLYVGQSKHIEARWRQHVYKLRTRRTHYLQEFIDWFHANGANEAILDFKVLEECSNDPAEKSTLEAKWFASLNPRFYGLTPSAGRAYEHTDETKQAIATGVTKAWSEYALVKDTVHKCVTCGKAFKSRRPNPQNCSRECQWASYRVDLADHRDEIIARSKAGESFRSIALDFGVAHPAISKIVAGS